MRRGIDTRYGALKHAANGSRHGGLEDDFSGRMKPTAHREVRWSTKPRNDAGNRQDINRQDLRSKACTGV